MDSEENNNKQKSFSYLFTYLFEYKFSLMLVTFFMLVESGVSLFIPWFAGQFSKAVLSDELLFGLTIIQICVFWVVLFSVQAVMRYLSVFRGNLIGCKILADLSCRLYEHLQMLPMGYFIDRKKGSILSLLSNDIAIISHFLSGVLGGVLPSLLIMSGAALMMLSIHFVTSLVILALIPVFYIVMKLIGKMLEPLSQVIVEKQASSVAIASENIDQIKLIKAFNREGYELERYKDNVNDIYHLRKKQLHLQALLSPLIQLLVSSGILVVVLICVFQFQAGELSMPEIISLLMYGFLFAKPTSNLAHLYGQVRQAKGASSRILDTLNALPEPANTGIDEVSVTGKITFDSVGFSYREGQSVLRNLSIDIQHGQTLVLHGPNGRGKTTVLHLLMRFIEPDQGNIYIDGHNLQDVNLTSLRQQIGFVPQEVSLCEGSIKDNIAFGYPQASLDEVVTVAKKTGIHEFIEQLDNGYNTAVGEGGVKLSGGQRQKVALARALLAEPKVILLDEPTSMFDQRSSAGFNNEFSNIFVGKTVVIATHDNDLARLADQVLEF